EGGIAERVLRPLADPQRDVARDRDAAVAHHGLEDVLVHRQRRAEDARADVGHPRELEQALHRAVLAERPVQDRKDDVALAERGGHLRSGHRERLGDRAVARPELPAPVAPDLDRHGLVALRVERVDQGPCRGERDLVLRRPSAEQHRDADPVAHGVGGGGGSVGVTRPTTIVTVEPCGALEFGVGLWLRPSPSSPGSVTSWCWTFTLKPALSSVERAEPSSWLVTSGTADCVGPGWAARVSG